jgi:hypothetical protein
LRKNPRNYFQSWFETAILLISTYRVARFIAVSHWHPENFNTFKRTLKPSSVIIQFYKSEYEGLQKKQEK